MGRKRRRRRMKPLPQPEPGADPLRDLVQTLFQGLRVTMAHGIQQFLTQAPTNPPMYRPSPPPAVVIKDAQVIAIRTEK